MVPEPPAARTAIFPKFPLEKALLFNVTELKSVKPETLVKNRYQKYVNSAHGPNPSPKPPHPNPIFKSKEDSERSKS